MDTPIKQHGLPPAWLGGNKSAPAWQYTKALVWRPLRPTLPVLLLPV